MLPPCDSTLWLCERTAWTDGLACVCLRESERHGVRCDIDEKPVCSSLVSPWLNVRSQWKGGTTNVTELLWQPDPWERRYPFNQMPFFPSAPFLLKLFSTFFLAVFYSSGPIRLYLTFAFLCPIYRATNCFALFALSPLFCPTHVHTHTKTQKQTHTPLFPATLLELSI